jgi:trimeric autotransporter adhesin
VVFGFTTAPNVTNNQTDNGGVHTLPVNFISIRAFEKQAGVGVEWKVASELNIDKYIVERSGDGTLFNSIGQANPINNTANLITYNLLDAKPLTGNNFYRISAVNKDGRIKYSPVIRIYMDKGTKDFAIYPNPVTKQDQLNLEFQDLPKDTYTLTMFNQEGQKVMNQIIQHEGGNGMQTISLQKIAIGTYTIEVRNQNMRFVKKLIVE